jgi:hypothetical protein
VYVWRPDGAHLRDIALELRDLASRCQFPRARLELRDLAVQFERRADHLDDVTEQRSVLPGVRWIQFDLTDEEVSALRKLLADAIDYDRYPLSLRVQALRYILAKFGPLASRPPTPTPQEPGPARPPLILAAGAHHIPGRWQVPLYASCERPAPSMQTATS